MVGQTLAHYRIVEKIGAGGMGEVYRATDTKLGRDVALKVLPDAFARDPNRLARFQREAQLLASLNHPHIAAIYGLEEDDDTRFLVLELVEGQTLAERLARGALPLDEALTLCRQIAEALEAAHEKGIIHRDLKPGNVKVTPEGQVKVLDFGLAKAFASGVAAADLSKSPTITEAATRTGGLLGTAAYMSPEQARGKPVDKRTDIWAFGCVLYEALTARRAFPGETVSDTVAGILKAEPDWSAVPGETPPAVQALLRHCLQKDPARRLHDIADARIEIEEVLSATPTPPIAESRPAPPRAASWRRAVPWGLVALLALLSGVALWNLRELMRTPRPLVRFVVALPPTDRLALGDHPAVALSPDGSHLVYVALRSGTTQLYLGALDQLEATPLAGTEGASAPFFSPDGQWVGFFAASKLKKVSILGGAPLTLCDASLNRGGSWGRDEIIFLTPTPDFGLSRVSAAGGAPQVVTTPDAKKRQRGHRWAEVLPGGQAVLFTIQATGGSFDDAQIGVVSLETGEQRILVEGGTNPHYASSGHLVFARGGSLLAVPFEESRLEVRGSPVPVLEGVMMNTTTGAAHFALSQTGMLAYAPGTARTIERTLFWVGRRGEARPVTQTRRAFFGLRVSPEGRRLAMEILGPTTDIWVYETGRDTLTRLTFEGNNFSPLWTPDGQRVTFSSDRVGPMNLYWKPADGSGPEERLLTSDYPQFASSWSPDGQALAFTEIRPATGADIWILPLTGERKPRPFLQTPFEEYGASFSPDGRWLAYTSNESGRFEVFVQPFPGPGGKWQISTDGGTWPRWAPNGAELYYRSGDKMVAVPVTTQPTFRAGTPRVLFEGAYGQGVRRTGTYDVAPDGQRFVMIRGEEESAANQFHVVLNWFEELKRRVPTTK